MYGYRTEGDARPSTSSNTAFTACEGAPMDRPDLRIAALFHDLGKPGTLREDDEGKHKLSSARAAERRACRADSYPAEVPETADPPYRSSGTASICSTTPLNGATALCADLSPGSGRSTWTTYSSSVRPDAYGMERRRRDLPLPARNEEPYRGSPGPRRRSEPARPGCRRQRPEGPGNPTGTAFRG